MAKNTEVRHPEKDLIVLWQRHVYARWGKNDSLEENDERVDQLADLAAEVEKVITGFTDEMDNSDIVVTISRRPLFENFHIAEERR